MNVKVQVGDVVQARQESPGGLVVTEFTVTRVRGGTVEGSPLGVLKTGDGWVFEVCRKGDPGLPDTLSILAAWMVQDRSRPVKIIGPDDGVWREPSGARVYPRDVLAWLPWGDYTPGAV